MLERIATTDTLRLILHRALSIDQRLNLCSLPITLRETDFILKYSVGHRS